MTINITVAVTLLMVSIYISKATQIASFPTILLITTLYRLSLDISATRLILPQADAGEVIRAFGMFVVGGNFVVGAVIFLIITLVQFIVITKGSERVAEVAARFTLDAMPGKQMSIDADMRAGIIDFEEGAASGGSALPRIAVLRRHGWRDEVRQGRCHRRHHHRPGEHRRRPDHRHGHAGYGADEAVQTYSILTIGNGLVAQIPALLISISAGMVVTRVASETEDTNLAKDVATQVLAQPKAIAVSAGFLFALALVPGLPKIPFLLLAATAAAVASGCLTQPSFKGSGKVMAGKLERSQEPQIDVTVPLVLEVSEGLNPFICPGLLRGRFFWRSFARSETVCTMSWGLFSHPSRSPGTNHWRRVGTESG